ncbi:MAG TPA: urea transporter, partial [Steroidobacteraceae bacterium]|nr:urea transporter [Steroidobacteraceae bacterium]
MKALLATWEKLCVSSAVLRFVDVNLRGVGQVMFMDNPLSGLLFLVAIGWGSYAGGVPQVAIGGIVALLASTFAAYWLDVDRADLHAGLFGFNAYLVGLALPTFLAPSPLLWAYVALGGAVSVVAMLAIARVCKTWGIAALTAPFVLTALLMLLAARAFAGFETSALPLSALVMPIDPSAANPLRLGDFIEGLLQSISQVFLKGNGLSALLLVAGLAVNSIPAAVFAVAGAAVAVVTAHLLGAESALITAGLLGFSPLLTAIALGCVFYQPSFRVAIYALIGTVFTVILQGAMNLALTPYGLPALTASFVIATWLFLLPGLPLKATSQQQVK